MSQAITSPGELGKIVRAVRIQAGLTQAEAAAACGVSTPFLHGLERGKPTARIERIFTVCRGLGIGIRLDLPVSIAELERVGGRKRRRPRPVNPK